MTSMLEGLVGVPRRALKPTEIVTRLADLPGWKLSGDGADVAIEKTFTFADYYETIAFVNALAFVATARTTTPTCRCTTTAAWCASARTTCKACPRPTSSAPRRSTPCSHEGRPC
jgi:hypothetical protein